MSKNNKYDHTAKERKRKERKNEKENMPWLRRRDVKAHEKDWPKIRELENKLKINRIKIIELELKNE